MWFGRIGGALVIVGGSAYLIAIPIIVLGDRIGSELNGVVQQLFPAALVPMGVGMIILGATGSRPLWGALVRTGLTMLGVGLLAYLAANTVPPPDGKNTLESWPHIFGLFGGLLAVIAGTLITGLALVRSPGPRRTVGALLLAGPLVVPLTLVLTAVIEDSQLGVVGSALPVIGLAMSVLGVMGIGVLAIGGDRQTRSEPQPVAR